ncbi:MAG: hypothetical protein LUI05_01210 [Oscillospiraceae bacterium]|nr:hypothetical protein [Oscillospiraceae bacterium]
MDIYFHIPDFFKHFRLHMVLITVMKNHPEYFRDGVKIGSIYGSFPPAMWNGGRGSFGITDERTIREILNAFNSKGIPCRFTFTNPLIKKEHLGDPFCNGLMRVANNGLNQVIVNSPILEEYIRENYPKYPITSSTCKQIRDPDELKAELEKDYNLVVLDYNWNNNFDFLEKVPHKEKCELLINACCMPNCPRRGEHYKTIGQSQINCAEHAMNPLMKNKLFRPIEFECPYEKLHLYQTTGFSTHISPDDLYNKYVPMGYNQFKIEGRTVPDINVLENYVYYMVKPEFKDIARLEMLGILTSNVKHFK